ncbi:MAG: S41 family peptidase [bacterium]|nr:S41 family peptidase [bacterium]
MKFKTFFLLFIFLSVQIHAQTLTSAEKVKILTDVIQKIEKIYPFPEISEKIIGGLNKQISDRYYDGINSPIDFATQVTNNLETFSSDKHLDLIYNPGLAKALLEETSNSSDYTEEEAKTEIWNNYGFKELKILDGNVGYLNLSVFFSTDYAAKVADATMNYFSNCNALIIDLRENGGGWGDMVVYLLAYFIDNKEPLVLNTTQSTLDSTIYSEVVPAQVTGRKLTDIPVYVLTSQVTASAAEAFTAHLKYFNKNTVIVGRKTKGAENPVEHIAIDENFVLQIPAWKKIYSGNPLAWEGIGINPDIEVEPENAFPTAYKNALQKLLKTANEQTAIDKYQWALDGLSASYDNIDINTIKEYADSYGKIQIKFIDDKLYYQSEGSSSNLLIPISADYFIVKGLNYFRIKFIKNESTIILKQIFTFGVEREYVKSK